MTISVADVANLTEISIEGKTDKYRRTVYFGKAVKMTNGTWNCLAAIDGRLCRVEIKISAIVPC